MKVLSVIGRKNLGISHNPSFHAADHEMDSIWHNVFQIPRFSANEMVLSRSRILINVVQAFFDLARIRALDHLSRPRFLSDFIFGIDKQYAHCAFNMLVILMDEILEGFVTATTAHEVKPMPFGLRRVSSRPEQKVESLAKFASFGRRIPATFDIDLDLRHGLPPS